MNYTINDLLTASKMIAKKTFGKKSQYNLQFNKEDDNLWYVDFPNWPFDHHNLLMVGGADKLCAFLSKDGSKALVSVEPAKAEKSDAKDCFVLERKEHSLTGGATYKVSNLEGFDRDIWLCPVTLFVLGQYPEYMYVKNIG